MNQTKCFIGTTLEHRTKGWLLICLILIEIGFGEPFYWVCCSTSNVLERVLVLNELCLTSLLVATAAVSHTPEYIYMYVLV